MKKEKPFSSVYPRGLRIVPKKGLFFWHLIIKAGNHKTSWTTETYSSKSKCFEMGREYSAMLGIPFQGE